MKMEEDEGMLNDPYKIQHKACLTWLWIAKTDPFIKRRVCKDVAKVIAMYVQVVLLHGFSFHRDGELLIVDLSTNVCGHIWKFRKNKSKIFIYGVFVGLCHTCLRPLVPILVPNGSEGRLEVRAACVSRNSNHYVDCYDGACKNVIFAMSHTCFDNFRISFDLPFTRTQRIQCW